MNAQMPRDKELGMSAPQGERVPHRICGWDACREWGNGKVCLILARA